jgi:hypothetical protein
MRILPALVLGLAVAGPALADRTPVQSAPAPGETPLSQRQDCNDGGYRRVDTAPVSARRLGDLPRADMHLLVDRRVDGCRVPTIVVRDVEANLTRRDAAPAPRR